MNNKIILFYHYYELDSIYKENFIHFLKFGYCKCIDYIIIISGKITLELPLASNLTYLYVENKNMDIGGFSKAITKVDINLYDYFFFLNCTVRGPYLSNYEIRNWTNIYIEKFDKDVGIVGNTINILSNKSVNYINYSKKYTSINCTHVQTYLYVLNINSLNLLLENNFYNNFTNEMTKEEIIVEYEIRLSQIILNNKLNIKCILNEYNDINYIEKHEDININSMNGDLLFEHCYYGRTVHPLEIIFIKTNRNLVNLYYLDKLSYSAHARLCSLKKDNNLLLDSDYTRRLIEMSVENEVVEYKESYSANEIIELTKRLVVNAPQYKKIIQILLNNN